MKFDRTKKALVFTSVLIPSFAYAANDPAPETLKFPLKSIKAIEIETTSGMTVIDATTKSSEIIVKVQKQVFEEGCSFTNTERRGKLDLTVRGKSQARCEVNFTVSVPASIEAEVKTGSGDILVNGVQGELELSTGSGNIRVDSASGKLDLKTGSGQIMVTRIESREAEFHSGSGNIDLTYVAVPQTGELEIKTGSGNVKLAVPAGSKFTTKVATGSGTFVNEIGETQKAKFQIQGKLGSGSMTIRKL